MSYLEVPRVHFGGLFFTDPSTINNLTYNYTTSIDLKTPEGVYDLQATSWNPTGVAQLWLRDCKVLSVVGADGKPVTATSADALVGAAVESASPETPQEDGQGGFYDIAKLVDVDPDQQMRSEVWGLRVFVKIPGGGGVSGRLLVPHLRDAFPRGGGGFGGYMQVIGGSWLSRLVELEWHDAASPGSSPVLDKLRQTSPDGLALKLTVDLYQRDRRVDLENGDGNRFGFGRVMGTFGPVGENELAEIVPGRRLYDPSSLPESRPAFFTAKASTAKDGGDAKEEAGKKVGALADETALRPWNGTDFILRPGSGEGKILSIDLGSAAPLSAQGRGKLAVNGPIEIGPEGGQPFAKGTITIDDASYVTLADALALKDTVWLPNCGIYDVELSKDEADSITRSPVGVAMGSSILTEPASGLYLGIDPPVMRMEPGATSTDARLGVYVFGEAPSTLPSGVSLGKAKVFEWPDVSAEEAKEKGLSFDVDDTSDVSFTVASNASVPGQFPLTVKTSAAVSLVPIRQPLDSQVYAVDTVPSSQDQTAPLSVLFWQNHDATKDPTWDTIVGRVLGGYARLYPGMKGRLDIGDEATVRGFANVVLGYMSRELDDPSYMPVVRDLSPTMMTMLRDWLEKTVAEMKAAD